MNSNQDNINIAELPPVAANSIEAQVGNTPLLDISPTAQKHGVSPNVKVLAKAEWFNPSGSVKDRQALHIIRTAEHTGILQPGMTILDSTSGNMGIAYALLGTARGYKIKLALPANASPERINILNIYGVDLILSDPLEGSDGAIIEAQKMAKEDDTLFYANQYANPANWQSHYWTTGQEVWEQTNGEITHFVAGLGTTGTFMGTTRRLKTFNKNIVCVACQPDGPFFGLEGWKHMPSAIQPAIYDPNLADENIETNTERSYKMAKQLAKEAGLFVSPSAAGAAVSAFDVARNLQSGVVVTIMADNAFKYLSDKFWEAE